MFFSDSLNLWALLALSGIARGDLHWRRLLFLTLVDFPEAQCMSPKDARMQRRRQGNRLSALTLTPDAYEAKIGILLAAVFADERPFVLVREPLIVWRFSLTPRPKIHPKYFKILHLGSLIEMKFAGSVCDKEFNWGVCVDAT